MVAERLIDERLVPAAIGSAGLEPGYDVRVQPQRDLLLHWPVEHAPPGIGPADAVESSRLRN